jgi:hypothetical protein
MTFDAPPDDELLRLFAAAPLDDEPETEQERAAVHEVEADRAASVASVPFNRSSADTSGRETG